jgi:hypothetical protein
VAVYLDTNVLVQRGGIGSLAVSTTIAICREAEIEIVVPALVADEVESSRQRVLEGAFDGLVAAHREAGRLASLPTLPELPNPGELAREYRRQLEERFSVVATPAGAAAEALRRETFRLRPARVGKGARDVAIWITVRDDHLSRNETGYFVTNNSRDFAATGSNTDLYPALADEISGHPEPLVLCPALPNVAQLLAEHVDPFVDEAALSQMAAFKRAAGRLLHDASFFASLEPPEDLNLGPDGQMFAGSEVAVSLSGVHQLDGYRVEDRQICVGQLALEMAFDLGTLEKAGVGRLQRTLPVRCEVIALVWLGEGPEGTDPVVEIAHVVHARAVAV